MLEPRYVDSREQRRRTALQRCGFISRQLDTGDVAFLEYGGETVLIEHKTVKLLLDDMVSGQLTRQMRRMCDSTPFPILLIEGHWQQAGGSVLGTGYTWEQAWNQLQSIQDQGARIQLTTSFEHTVERILQLAEYYAQPWHPSMQRSAPGDIRIAVLSFIHGIDQAKAQALLNKYGTLEYIAVAPERYLMDVQGIGPVLAKRIRQFFTSSYK